MGSQVALPQAWAVASASVGKGWPTCVLSFILSNAGSLSGVLWVKVSSEL